MTMQRAQSTDSAVARVVVLFGLQASFLMDFWAMVSIFGVNGGSRSAMNWYIAMIDVDMWANVLSVAIDVDSN
jgi:hypothetical protein